MSVAGQTCFSGQQAQDRDDKAAATAKQSLGACKAELDFQLVPYKDLRDLQSEYC